MDGDQMTKTDFLGNEYSVGDIIVYAGQSGRSVQMVKAEVTDIKENGNVVVQPLAGSRWGRTGNTRYIDSRSGKGISLYATDEHAETPAHYRNVITGAKLTSEERWSLGLSNYTVYQYVPTVFKDYVQEVKDLPKKVTLTVTENIVLLEKKNG